MMHEEQEREREQEQTMSTTDHKTMRDSEIGTQTMTWHDEIQVIP